MAFADPLPAKPLPAPPSRPLLGILFRLLAMIMLATMFVFAKIADDMGVHVTESLFWRQLAGLPVSFAFLWWQ
ncbi:MAG: hypothetical protein ACK473_00425, partial [Sphingomonadales bacterium]